MPTTVRHPPRLAASPRLWHKLEVERGGDRGSSIFMDAEVIDIDDEHLVGSYSALLVLMWGARTLPEKLVTVIAQAKAFLKRWPRISVMVVVERDSEMPNKEARKKLEELAAALLGHTVATVYVFEGTGFRASAMRTLMTMLMLVGTPSVRQYKVLPTIDDGLDWLVPFLAGPEFGNEADRRRAVHALQQRFLDYRANPEDSSRERKLSA
jgi:hypothetical protein